MLDSSDKVERFDELLAAYLDETIEEADLAEFSELVTADPKLTADLRSQLLIDSQLSEFKTSAKGATTFQQKIESVFEAEANSDEFVGKVLEKARPVTAKSRCRLSLPILAILSVVLIAFAGLKFLNPDSSKTAENYVATVTSIKGEVSGDNRPIKVGAQLVSDILDIPDGFVELEFANGAQMGVLGPAKFELVNANRVFCHYGKIRVGVPPAARGFTVVTPTSEIVDLGTEFAMTVNSQGDTELHVFEGKVDAYNSKRDPKSRKTYKKGQAVRIVRNQPRKNLGSDHSVFGGIPPYKGVIRSSSNSAKFRAWKAVRHSLRQDPRLVVYYDFQSSSNSASVLTNVAGSSRGQMDGLIEGATWGAGPWAGKQALTFHGKDEKVLIEIPEDFSSLSLAGWVKVDKLNRVRNSLLTPVEANPGEVFFSYWKQGSQVLGVRSQQQGKPEIFLVKDVVGGKRLGQWFHFAAVIDSDAKTITKYIDGNVVLSSPFEVSYPLSLRNSLIGNRVYQSKKDRTGKHSLNGSIAELMIFKAPLDRSEIRHIALIPSSE